VAQPTNLLQIGELKIKIKQLGGKLAADCLHIIYEGKFVSNDVTIASTGVTEDSFLCLVSDIDLKVRRDASGLREELTRVVGI
jgi:hypothetical protein